MVSYDGLYEQLQKKGITKTDLTSEIGISSRTIAKIAKGEKLSRKTMQKIADYLGCEAGDLCREKSDNAILQILRDEKEAKISGGLYHELQVRMTYNSNHIEGSKLTEDQTRLIFETNTIDVGDGVPVDDILETVHHFRAIDYVIDTAEEELSEEIIKHGLVFRQFISDKYRCMAWTSQGIDGNVHTTKAKEKGKPMTVSGIRYILGNESYVGDKLLQKQAPRDFLTKKPDKNAKYESKYLVDDHEAVISREVWDTVQLRLGQHQEEVVSGGYYDGRSHFLHGRVFCGDCGAMMTRRTVRCSSRPDNKETHKVWTCKERHKGRKGNGCLMRNIPEEELLAAICFQMGLPNAENFPVGRFRREIERVEVMDNGVWVVPRRMVKTA